MAEKYTKCNISNFQIQLLHDFFIKFWVPVWSTFHVQGEYMRYMNKIALRDIPLWMSKHNMEKRKKLHWFVPSY